MSKATYCREQSASIAKESKKEISELQKKLKEMEENLATTMENNLAEIATVKREINNYYEKKTKGSIFHTRAR